jgi:hypothetical protein
MALAGCGGGDSKGANLAGGKSDTDAGAARGKSDTDAGAEGPRPGYVRYKTNPIDVPPGTSAQWFEWIAAPLDHDVDVVDIIGTQPHVGHHATLYAVQDAQPIGTVQPWDMGEQLQAHILGGIGGEGGTAVKLPEGAVFRLPAGQSLAVQTHYLNAGADDAQGITQLDIKFGDPSPSDLVASLFTNASLAFQVPPAAQYHVDVKCTVGADLGLLMYSNHMHEWGTTVSTSLVDGTGNQRVIKNDPVWNVDWVTNPNFKDESLAAPLQLHAGDTLTTSCDWNNTTSSALTFPKEMCVFLGFFVGDADITCVDGTWQKLGG